MQATSLEYNLSFCKLSINNSHCYRNCPCGEGRETPNILSISTLDKRQKKNKTPCLSHPRRPSTQPDTGPCGVVCMYLTPHIHHLTVNLGTKTVDRRPWLLPRVCSILLWRQRAPGASSLAAAQTHQLPGSPWQSAPGARKGSPAAGPGQHSPVWASGFHDNRAPGSRAT